VGVGLGAGAGLAEDAGVGDGEGDGVAAPESTDSTAAGEARSGVGAGVSPGEHPATEPANVATRQTDARRDRMAHMMRAAASVCRPLPGAARPAGYADRSMRKTG
jgi:hypothetical protein